MSKIKNVIPREILNAGGMATIETTVVLSDGSVGTASAPSGTVGVAYEAAEFTSADTSFMQAPALFKSLEDIQNVIAPKIIGHEANKQQEIDKILIELDGTQNKSRLGANIILSVSAAVAKASAESSVLPLFLYLKEFVKKPGVKIPTPIFSLINGGASNGANLDFAEFLIIPASSKSYTESLKIGNSVYNALKKNLNVANLSTLTTTRGAFAPTLPSNTEACAILKTSIEEANLKYNFDVFMGIDASANNLSYQDKYKIKDKNTYFSSAELIGFYKELQKTFNLLYLEDGLREEDWEGWSSLYNEMSQNTVIAGDDITATNPYRLQMALNKKAVTAVLVKPNQVGTVIEALAFSEIANAAGLKTVVSNRSVETNDDFIADFAVATSADYIKFGAPQRGEHVAKYNRLLQIERQLKSL